MKKKPDGSVDRYKARLVTKGFSQHTGMDFVDTFSPVVLATIIQTVLALAAINGWVLRQVDVNNVFLNDILTEEIYIDKPPSFKMYRPSGEKLICNLNKALYGLKLAPRA